jgi:hypothetical protein
MLRDRDKDVWYIADIDPPSHLNSTTFGNFIFWVNVTTDKIYVTFGIGWQLARGTYEMGDTISKFKGIMGYGS